MEKNFTKTFLLLILLCVLCPLAVRADCVSGMDEKIADSQTKIDGWKEEIQKKEEEKISDGDYLSLHANNMTEDQIKLITNRINYDTQVIKDDNALITNSQDAINTYQKLKSECSKPIPKPAEPSQNLKPIDSGAWNFTKAIVPDCNGAVTDQNGGCNFDAFMKLISNIITFLLYIAIPIAAVSFFFAGFLYLTAGGNPGKIEEAHQIFWSVMIGIIIMLSAWLLVNTIVKELLDPSFNSYLG